MKKIKHLFAMILIVLSMTMMVACNGNEVESLIITSGLPDTVEKDSTLVTDDVVATITFNNGKVVEVTSEDLEFGEIDTSTAGRKGLVVKYENFEQTIYIDVVDSETVSTLTMLESDLNMFNENRLSVLGSESDEAKIYYVGDDNPFSLRLKAAGVNSSGDVVDNLTEYELYFEIELKEDGVYKTLSEETINNYVTFNDDHTLDFTSSAIGKEFNIVVRATHYNTYPQPSFTLPNIKVVDGYNVYTAEDFSVIDNTEENGWKEFKSESLLESSKNAKGVVLHNTIRITDNDIPSNFFYSQSEFNNMNGITAIANAKNVNIVGSLKDEMNNSWTNIYKRKLSSNENFAFYGNYNQIDASKITKVVIAGSPTDAGEGDVVSIPDISHPESGTAITSHATLVKFEAVNSNSSTPNLIINNVSLVGNGARSSSAYNSGGLILTKIKGVNSVVERTSFYDFLIGYMYECLSEYESKLDLASHQLKNTKGENCYSSLIYNWASHELTIEDSSLVGAGGPVMIIDYKVDKDNPSQEWIPTVNVINSKLESFVTGSEPWFTTYGASALLSQITPAEALYNGSYASSGLVDTGKNFIVDRAENGKTIENMINVICVFKDAGAEGITPDRVKGSITIFDTREDYEKQLSGDMVSYGLVSPKDTNNDNLTDKAMTSGLVYFQSSKTGGYINSGFGSANTDATIMQGGAPYVDSSAEKEYVNLYLMNGMGLIFELFRTNK